MRCPPSDKAEIIRLVEESHPPVRQTQEPLGIPRAMFYRWYDRHLIGGPEVPQDRPAWPDRVWNRNPVDIRCQIIDRALELPELSPRGLAVRFPGEKTYFVSKASVYRLLKADNLITSPAFIVIKAADEFKDKTTAPSQPWQTGSPYLKVAGWVCYFLSTVLDVFSRFIIAARLRTMMRVDDETPTLNFGRRRTRFGNCRPPSKAAVRQWRVLHRERSGDMARQRGQGAYPGRAVPPPETRQSDNPALVSRVGGCKRGTNE
jgi:putative transposase